MARRSITLEELDKLQVDEANRLYWDGVEVVTRVILSLEWWQQLLVMAAAVSTIGIFVLMALNYFGIRPPWHRPPPGAKQ